MICAPVDPPANRVAWEGPYNRGLAKLYRDGVAVLVVGPTHAHDGICTLSALIRGGRERP